MKSKKLLSLLLPLIVLGATFGVGQFSPNKSLTKPVYAAGQIKTVFVIVMENHDWAEVKGAAAPYITNTLLPNFAHAENYHNVVTGSLHPSEPNYVLLEGGTNVFSDKTFTEDADPSSSNSTSSTSHLVTELTSASITWRAYQEGISGSGCPIASNAVYSPKHLGVMFFQDVVGNPPSTSNANCSSHVRPYTELATDLSSGQVASYNFITPNLTDDMHDGSIQQGDTWLSQEVEKIKASQAYQNGGVIFITWDEGSGTGNNPIGLIAISPLAKTNYSNSIAYSHTSLVKSIQEIFGVTPLLGGAANATDLSDLFTVPLTSTTTPSTNPQPTFFTLHPCPTCESPSEAPLPTAAPTVIITTPQPTIDPCTVGSVASAGGASVAASHHKSHGGSISGFFQQIIQFFMQLLNLLLQLLGQQTQQPNPTPTPGPSIVPTNSTVEPTDAHPTTTEPTTAQPTEPAVNPCEPSFQPTEEPSDNPSPVPSEEVTQPASPSITISETIPSDVPSIAPSDVPSTVPSEALPSETLPSETVPSETIAPSSAVPSEANPTVDPCDTVASVAASRHKKSKHKQHQGMISKFMDFLIKFFKQLLQIILGQHNPGTPGTNPEVTPGVSPEITEPQEITDAQGLPTDEPTAEPTSDETSPTTNPCPSPTDDTTEPTVEPTVEPTQEITPEITTAPTNAPQPSIMVSPSLPFSLQRVK